MSSTNNTNSTNSTNTISQLSEIISNDIIEIQTQLFELNKNPENSIDVIDIVTTLEKMNNDSIDTSINVQILKEKFDLIISNNFSITNNMFKLLIQKIKLNFDKLEELTTAIEAVSGFSTTYPLGFIMPIYSTLSNTYVIPATGVIDAAGFMYCDGSTIPGDGLVVGNVPDMTNILLGTIMVSYIIKVK